MATVTADDPTTAPEITQEPVPDQTGQTGPTIPWDDDDGAIIANIIKKLQVFSRTKKSYQLRPREVDTLTRYLALAHFERVDLLSKNNALGQILEMSEKKWWKKGKNK